MNVADGQLLSKYSHGLNVADFYVCNRCGTYVAAVMASGDAAFATLNINTLEDNPFGDRRGAPADYASEDAAGRAARRVRMWTPISIHYDEDV